MHNGDVLLALAKAGLVDADPGHLAHVLLAPGLGHIVLDPAPELLVTHAQHPSGLTHGQALAHREGERLEEQREAAAFAGPRHRHLGGLAARRAAHARQVRMQPGLELEEVEVAPLAADPIMNALIERAKTGAGQPLGRADNLEVDTPLGGVQIDLGDLPWSLQAECSGEQGLDLN